MGMVMILEKRTGPRAVVSASAIHAMVLAFRDIRALLSNSAPLHTMSGRCAAMLFSFSGDWRAGRSRRVRRHASSGRR